jgi:hypothetical protein
VIKSILNQSDYTREFLRAAGMDEEIVAGGQSLWWNPVNTNHLRLSMHGIKFIKSNTKIPIYSISLASPLLSRHFISLSRICFCPYYIKHQKTLLLLGKEEATMLTLHAGNLGQYLDNMEV